MSYSFDMNFGDVIDLLLPILLVVYLLVFILCIVIYVFESLGLYTMAKRRGISNYGLAWVPVGNYWIIGRLADQFCYAEQRKKTAYRHLLLWGGLILTVLSMVIVVYSLDLGWNTATGYYYADEIASSAIGVVLLATFMSMVSIAVAVFQYIALYKIYKSCSPSSATVLLVLSILFSIVTPFVLFALRKKDEGYVQLNQQWAAQQTAGQQPQQ